MITLTTNPISYRRICISCFWVFLSSSHGKPLKWHSCLGWHMVCFTFLCTTHGPFALSMHMHQHNQGMASLNGILFKARKVDATFHFQLCIVMTSTLQHLLGTWYLPLPSVIHGVKIFLKYCLNHVWQTCQRQWETNEFRNNALHMRITRNQQIFETLKCDTNEKESLILWILP